MTTNRPIDMYQLLPEVYRIEDARHGYKLRALMDIISEQANIIHEDISSLWDNFFIETCAPWVVPYIGDLVGNIPIHEVARGRRADVAKTIYYRLRKGTLPMLEELARDVTGWSAHAVAFFDIMTWSQNMNHLRPTVGAIDIRSLDVCDRVSRPFDSSSHSVDVRPIGQADGWHNIRNVGFFLWRLGSYRVSDATPRKSDSNNFGYHFSSLGNPAPLFNRPERETDPSGLASEIHIAGPIRPTAFWANQQDYYDRSISITVNGQVIPLEDVICKNLSVWVQPTGSKVGIDVARGRFVLGPDLLPVNDNDISVSYSYGFSADMGGGSYDRRQRGDTVFDPESLDLLMRVPSPAHPTIIQDAIDAWQPADPALRSNVIEIDSSATFIEDLDINPDTSGGNVTTHLVIQAANGQRPTIKGRIRLHRVGSPMKVTLNGLVIEGHVEVDAVGTTESSKLRELEITHCTLVPGRTLDEDGSATQPGQPSLIAGDGNDLLKVAIHRSIVGPLRLPTEMAGLNVSDSIIDGIPGSVPSIASVAGIQLHGPKSSLERVTVFGEVKAREIELASEVIFNGLVTCQRRQEGCIRFSYVPPGSVTPRRFRCQPDLAHDDVDKETGDIAERNRRKALILERLVPIFTSRRYGDPGYAQLGLNCPVEIRTGAENYSEMGAFHHLMQPQRESNLHVRMAEYLPFGLEYAVSYIT